MPYDVSTNVVEHDPSRTRGYFRLWSNVLLTVIHDATNGCAKSKRALLDKENRRQLVFLAGLEPEFEKRIADWCHHNRDNSGKWVLTPAMVEGGRSVRQTFAGGEDKRSRKRKPKHHRNWRPKELIALEERLAVERRERRGTRGKRTREQIAADNATRKAVLEQNGFAEYV